MIIQTSPISPNKTNNTRQLEIVKNPDTIGAVINAPNGTPIKPSADSNPRSFGAAQLAFVLLIVEKIGPSDTPNNTRINPNPAIADPPNNAMPISPAKAIPISNSDHNVPATSHTNFGPFVCSNTSK